MLASVSIFPVSVVLGALVVHDLGPARFFPIAAAPLAGAIAAGLSQRSWRNLGAASPHDPPGPSGQATNSQSAPAWVTADGGRPS
jgi:hypothetical protein